MTQPLVNVSRVRSERPETSVSGVVPPQLAGTIQEAVNAAIPNITGAVSGESSETTAQSTVSPELVSAIQEAVNKAIPTIAGAVVAAMNTTPDSVPGTGSSTVPRHIFTCICNL